MSLTRGEAEYLAERIRLSPACSGSLLAELVAQRKRSDDVAFAWEHPHCAKLPPKLREILDHARNFSDVMHGAPLLYNLILAEQAHWDEGVAKYKRAFGEWAKAVSARSRVLAQWDRKRFWEIVRSVNPRITSPTFEFINAWWDLVLGGDPARLRDSAAARLLIHDRERRLKKSLARIDNPARAGTLDRRFRHGAVGIQVVHKPEIARRHFPRSGGARCLGRTRDNI